MGKKVQEVKLRKCFTCGKEIKTDSKSLRKHAIECASQMRETSVRI